MPEYSLPASQPSRIFAASECISWYLLLSYHCMYLVTNVNINCEIYRSCYIIRQVLEEIFMHFMKLASLTESILNQSLSLPTNCLKEYNNDRTHDFLLGLHYFPETETANVGKSAHTYPSCITLLYQDEVGGLQVCKNGQWIPVAPMEGALIINAGDVLRVSGFFFFFSVFLCLLFRFLAQ